MRAAEGGPARAGVATLGARTPTTGESALESSAQPAVATVTHTQGKAPSAGLPHVLCGHRNGTQRPGPMWGETTAPRVGSGGRVSLPVVRMVVYE